MSVNYAGILYIYLHKHRKKIDSIKFVKGKGVRNAEITCIEPKYLVLFIMFIWMYYSYGSLWTYLQLVELRNYTSALFHKD